MIRTEFENIPKEVVDAYDRTIGFLKEMMAVCNNAAWCISLDAYDELKKLPNWNRKVKGGKTVAECFKRVFKEYHEYESALVYDTKFGLFDINSFPEEARRKYGENITNRDLYDHWASVGATTYDRMRPLVTSLQNRFKIGIENIGVKKNVDIKACGLTAYNCINMAVHIYNQTIDVAAKAIGASVSQLGKSFSMFSLANVLKLWGDALDAAFTDVSFKKFTDFDKKNAQVLLNQIGESWSKGDQIFGDMKRTIIETGSDVFKTKGFLLKEADKMQNNLEKWEEYIHK